MRFGECQALNWNDIDFAQSSISITKTYARRTKKITAPKTTKSIRVIAIPHFINDRLKEKYEHDKDIYGFKNEWFIFGCIKPYSEATARKHLIKHIDKAKCKPITLHGFRHSHALCLLEYTNLPDSLIAERLGHSVEMLQKTYSHIYAKRKDEMNNYIRNIKI